MRMDNENAKLKLFISVSDLVRAEESQKVIDELLEVYDDGESPKAGITRATIFSNGYLRGLNISIRSESKYEANMHKEEFNGVYKELVKNLKRKPMKHISLIDIEHLQIKKF